MSKPLLFVDFNGVLSYNKFWNELEDESHEFHHYWPTLQEYLFVTNKDLMNQWMLGEMTSEEVHRVLESALSIPYDFLFPMFVDGCKTIDISDAILEKVEALRNNFTCILATANMDSLERFTIPSYPQLPATFDYIDNSYRVKLLKHTDNGRYFTERAAQLNVPLAECVLIDDSSRTCAIFESLGGKAFNVTGEENVCVVLDSLKH